MDHFIVSARKYRPESFSSVVGQAVITSTLKNTIKTGKLGHAYLFCGPRGVGKTTCARIFAKTINCSNLSSDTEPCNECESCKSFNESRSYNIHELDAASNNSVDDIRLLTEKVRIPPQIGRYSVYIIDEVHMLSLAAFNSFLKTLEEPPRHAVFILATTEKHKIIPTILSRCQIFDFARIKAEDAAAFLEQIALKENIQFEKEALHVIARKADGAMRDALSIFDQLVSFSNGKISYQAVIDNLNVLDYDYFFKITGYIFQSDISACLLLLDEVISRGFDPQHFINGLASHFRDLLVCTNSSTLKLLDVSEKIKEQYLQQSSVSSPEILFKLLEFCNQADLAYKNSRNQRLLIELALMKMCSPGDIKKNSLSDQGEIPVKESPGPEGINSPVGQEKPEPFESNGIEAKTVRHIRNIADKSPAQPVKGNVVRTAAISIKDALNNPDPAVVNLITEEIAGDESVLQEENLHEDPFSQEDLVEKWKQYAEKIKTERPRIYHTLNSREPVLEDGYRVLVNMDNAAQMDDFGKSVMNDLTIFLRKELSNDLISIKGELIDEPDEQKRKVYTNEDKFQYLSNKNPVLGKLRQQLNLDFE